jgi:hypothetical protein
MAEQITYYAIVDQFSSRAQPAGVLRRIQRDGGTRDEVFSGELKWVFSSLKYSAERGDLANEFVSITEAEAMQIVDRIKALAGSAE